MLRRLGLGLVATKNCGKVAKYVAKSFFANRRPCLSIVATKDSSKVPKHIARCFHTNPSYHSNCDFGSPCDCIECREAAKIPVCEICRVRPTTNQSWERSYDRKGVSGYTFTSFCDLCWKVHLEKERKREQENKQALALRKNKVDKMLEYVRGLHSMEQVPIAYAVDRLMSDIRSVKRFSNSRRWYQRYLVDHLSQDLGIVKTRNRYVCDKRRVDAMDFKQWYFYDSLDVDV
ncbi:unnamed protein product [Clonostachys rosea f. rosea IK726]|uniref:Uncharacterized protein n=1 Tax=Clonostachys rosea f. rosea IK726 TaxID=1349383 RepID=A0ACA9U8I0_BIOOC|nr:unnamed protein product [Clonostachys rosea f. rosea IK726]